MILGGGTAGAPAARSLGKQLGAEHRVILIEKEGVLINSAALPLYALGKRERAHFSRNRSSLGRHGVELSPGEVHKIDPAGKIIHTAREELSYDLLLITAGAVPYRVHPPGAAEVGVDLQSPEGAEKIRALLPHFKGSEIAIIVASRQVKCPCGPYEYALLLENWFFQRERSRDVNITIYTPEPAPLNLLGKKASRAVAGLLLNRSIRLHPGARISHIDPDNKMIFLEEGGGSFPFDLLLYYAAAAPPPFIRESGLAGKEGWLEVERNSMLLQNDDSIFAAGDVTDVRSPSGETLPRMGAVAHLQSLVAATNISRMMRGEKADSAYSGFAGLIIDTGRGALPLAGNFYKEVIDFQPFPLSRLWSPLKTLFTERWWLRHHS